MAKREALRIPLSFDDVLGGLLSVKPPAKQAKPKTRKATRKATARKATKKR